MSWGVFVIAAWIALGCEWGLRDALALGSTPIAPSFVLVLAVFVAMWAPSVSALTACLALGVAMDLLFQIPADEGARTIVGPHALALLLTGYTIVTSRTLVFRRNLRTAIFLTLLGGLIAAIVVTVLLALRSAYGDIQPGRAGTRLLHGFGSAAASAALALVLIPVLSLAAGAFGFRKPRAPEFGTRR